MVALRYTGQYHSSDHIIAVPEIAREPVSNNKVTDYTLIRLIRYTHLPV